MLDVVFIDLFSHLRGLIHSSIYVLDEDAFLVEGLQLFDLVLIDGQEWSTDVVLGDGVVHDPLEYVRLHQIGVATIQLECIRFFGKIT